MKKIIPVLITLFLLLNLTGCTRKSDFFSSLDDESRKDFIRLYSIMDNESLHEKRFILMRQILNQVSDRASNEEINLFLTTYTEQNRDDPFNAYYLMVVARNYRDDMAYPFAINYYERILKNHHDLMAMGNSIHYLCLKDLIEMTDDPDMRIIYYKDLLSRFSNQINIGETYYKLGNTYAEAGEWSSAVQAYKLFLEYPEATVSGDIEIRERIEEQIALYHSDRNWTFNSLSRLVDTVINDINIAKIRRDSRPIKARMAQINFFAVSWEESKSSTEIRFVDNIGSFLSPRISINRELDRASNVQEAYLKTTGWSYRIPTWYLYFRRINFPADPEIHGNWEWAGIYFGEKPFAASNER